MQGESRAKTANTANTIEQNIRGSHCGGISYSRSAAANNIIAAIALPKASQICLRLCYNAGYENRAQCALAVG